jgi:RNA polymerase sigma-70 factor (ECF subfamily)
VATPEEAEDITAEVFIAAFAALPRFRGQCSPYVWLLTIARRKIIDAARRRATRRETLASELADERAEAGYPTSGCPLGDRGGWTLWEAVASVEGPEAAVMRLESRRVLQELMAQLKPDQKEAFLLHYMERLPAAEIAAVMGRSVRAVYGLLHRARESLRQRGRDYFLDEEGGKTHD